MAAAIDTNVLVRFLTGDDPKQTMVAVAHISQGFVLLPTVAVEAERVLRASYGWPRERIEAALRDVIDLPEAIGFPSAMHWVLDRFAAGADFADMMHLSLAGETDAFLTFDRRIEKLVGDSPPVAVITLV
ncbi:type II toxin-antitoxin system VapC family toxin [Sphingobium sp. YR768]|jgi:predicted nucleic-acid-binding protein|uniref:type II toxin-antitoxin system VapC family toxin n=1 Tax=Sphingobium sp. YR768 TaxID=1884365 RepID=UPI0008BAF438|nr:type II toxin-antitoxin system VapC family toxin [Sphingobium sp. YR768]SEQ85895.1 Predicted nucleic-acid-binding protein, contains PIN domain [Sphingobium sp. YR768]